MFDDVDPRSRDDREREVHDSRDLTSPDGGDVFTRGLDLPHGPTRARVHVAEHGQDYYLRGSEVRALATIGAFRVVPADDLRDDNGRPGDVRHGDLEQLRSAGLVKTVAPLDREQRSAIVTLTDRGRDVLEGHRTHGHATPQRFYAGVVKVRELSHDAQLYRAYLRTAERLNKDDARIQRVVLDYELKREYQRFLQDGNRGRADSDGRPTRTSAEISEWAREHDLPIINDHVQFPDFRIEYERSDGSRAVENVEVTTLHYRGAHASGKVAAGFTRLRGSTARIGGSRSAGGSAPFDPHVAEEFLR